MKEKILGILEEMKKNIVFDELLHQYWFKGKETISVTQLLKKHGLSPDYSAVSGEVLKRAVNRGNTIHEDIEFSIKKNVEPATMEGEIYFNWLKQLNLEPIDCECLIGNELVCGQCDTILINKKTGALFIDDHKTGTVIHKEAVRWQGSIYAYLLGIYDDVEKILCSHLPKELSKCEMIELEKIHKSEIERLFLFEKKGIVFNVFKELDDPFYIPQIAELYEIENILNEIEENIKQHKERRDELKSQILEELSKSKIDKTEFKDMKISVKNGGTRKSVDLVKLKTEMPEIYEKYLKETKVTDSLIVKIGG